MLRKRIITFTIMIAMILSVLPISGFVNAAEEEDNTSDVAEITEKNINLGVSAIEDSDTENNKWDNIYYGKYGTDSLPFKWRVLSKNGNGGGGSSHGGGGGGGGGSVVTKYTVTFNSNGESNVENASVIKNAKVVEPSAPVKNGFDFVGWYGDEQFTKIYDFDTPITANVTLYAKWSEKDSSGVTDKDEIKLFDDVKYDDWYFENVKYVVEKNLMKGVTESEFAPDEIITRGMFVTVLYRAEGEPKVNKSIPFIDVLNGEYYSDAVVWTAQNEIVRGVTENNFAPNDNITREQMAVMMHRYTQYKGRDVYVGKDVDLTKYDDFDEVSEYAISALHHAVGIGLMKGKTETTLNPQDFATRAEVAAIIQRFLME